MTSARSAPDFDVQHDSTVALLQPNTEHGQAWCGEHLATEDALTWGRAHVVEPRYLDEILRTVVQAGLLVRLRG